MVTREQIIDWMRLNGFPVTVQNAIYLEQFALLVTNEEMNRCLRIVKNGCGDSVIEYGLTEAIINGDDE
jgi:hypothetical protein